jgi:hypothetical protein
MASVRQVAANRRNGLKGGVKTEEGKAVSRLNARKHGIFATALTPEDSEEASGIEEELVASIQPAGRVEEMLVEKIALTYLRMQRCARAEAEFHIETWREPHKVRESYDWERLQKRRRDGDRGSTFRVEKFERMVKLIDLYDARLTNQWLKLLHEVERLQALRKRRELEAQRCGEGPDDGATNSQARALVPHTNAQAEAPVPQTPQTEDVAPPPSAVACSVPVRVCEEAPDGATTNAPEPPPAPVHETPQVVDTKEAAAPMAV